MKKAVFVLAFAMLAALIFCGCGDSGEKPGGGGKMQSFDLKSGKYN